MERLTDEVLHNAIKTYEITSEIDDPDYSAVLDKCILEFLHELKAYRDAEEQGLLIRLPCVVGDLVYRINPYGKRPVRPMRVSKVVFAKSYSGYSKIEIYAIDVEDSGQYAFYEREINKAVFLTREEAEAALAKIEE